MFRAEDSGLAAADCSAASHGIEQRDPRAVGDEAPRLKQLVIKECPKRDGWQAGLSREISGNPRLGTRQRMDQFLQRARVRGKVQVYNRSAKYHARRTREGDLNTHDAG